MLVKDLKKALENVPDDLEVVALGHFGEGVRAGEPYDYRVCENVKVVNYGWSDHGKTHKQVFVIPTADIGPVPE